MNQEQFARAAHKAQQMDNDTFLEAILEERQDLKKKVKRGKLEPDVPGRGYSAYTVILGDEVFKTAQADGWRDVEMKDLVLGIERERNLLQYLQGKGLPVPEVTYTGKNLLFYGMTKLPGELLTRYDVEGLPADDKQALAKQLAGFCAGLANAVPQGAAHALGLDVSPAERRFDPESIVAKFADPRARETFGDKYDFFKDAIEKYIERHNTLYADGQKYLMHCDLKEGNILWDEDAKKLTGVIDFGLSHFTCLESGFKKLCEKFPANFVDMVLEEYSRLQSVPISRRDIQTWCCVEYADYALEEMKKNTSRWGVDSYESYVRAPLRLDPPRPTPETPVPGGNKPRQGMEAFT
jgi:aminoglycoside phosphotransferase (APT) family kinase protein